MNQPANHQQWTDVAVFEDLNPGRTIETLLTDQGIQARIYDDKLARRLLFLRPPRETFRLQVHTGDFHRAQQFLQADSKHSVRDAIHCPECGSRQISYPQMTRKFILPTIVLHVSIIFRLMDHQCYCDKCHCMWSLPKEATRLEPKAANHFPFT